MSPPLSSTHLQLAMSAADAPPAKKSKKETRITVSALFPHTPDVDIFVRTKETGWRDVRVELFGTTKVFLQAASTVFRDALAIASAGETHESIPIIDIEEDARYLELFLLHVHPGKLILSNGDLRPTTASLSTFSVLNVVLMAEKYDAPLVLNSVLNTYLPILYDPYRHLEPKSTGDADYAINAFGLAIAYRKLIHVRPALRSLETYKPDERCNDADDDFDAEERKPLRRAREFNLWHIYPGIRNKMPSRDIVEFCRVAGKIGPDYTWEDAAEAFTVSR